MRSPLRYRSRGARVGAFALTLTGVVVAGCATTATSGTTQVASATQSSSGDAASARATSVQMRATAMSQGRLVSVGEAMRASTPTSKPLAGKVIVIDPGHDGGNASHPAQVNRQVDIVTGHKNCDAVGTQTNAGYTEHAFTWDLAQRTAAVLRARGATVILTRPDDRGWGPCNTERAAIGNRAHADAAISIHADGAPATGRGFHVIAPGAVRGNGAIVAPSRLLATTVRDAFRSGAGMPFSTYTGGGRALTVRTDLGGLNLSRVPKVFIECGNMRNRTDAALLSSTSWRAKAGTAIANGLTRYLKP